MRPRRSHTEPGNKRVSYWPNHFPGVPWVNALDKPVSLALKSGTSVMKPFFHEPKESFYHERFAKVEQSLREEMTRIASSFFHAAMQPVRLAICRCFYLTGISGDTDRFMPGQSRSAAAFQSAADGEWLSGDKPSKEVLFHLRCIATIRAVKRWCICTAHGHGAFLPARAGQQQRYSSVHTYVVMRMGNIPLVPYYRPGDNASHRIWRNWQQTIRLFYWQTWPSGLR